MADPATEYWTFRPSYPIRESWEWSTQVLRCRSRTQRIARRALPRMIIQHEYVMEREDAYRAALIAANQQKVFLPLWQDGFRGKRSDLLDTPDHAIPAGDNSIYTQSLASLRFEVDKPLMIEDDDEYYEIRTAGFISWIESNAHINLSSGLTRDFANAVLTPLVEASVDFQITKQSGRYVTAKAVFVSTDSPAMTLGTLDQIAGPVFDTYRDETLINRRSAAPSKDRHWTEFDVIDNKVGTFEKYRKFDYEASKAEVDWFILQYEDLARIKVWLQGTRGKQKGFWVPTFNSDIVPVSGLGGSVITIQYCGYAKYQETGHIVMIDQAGAYHAREVLASVELSDTEEQLQLDSALPANPVDVISQLRWMRFDTDKIELNFGSPGIGFDITDPMLASATVRAPIVEDVPGHEIQVAEPVGQDDELPRPRRKRTRKRTDFLLHIHRSGW